MSPARRVGRWIAVATLLAVGFPLAGCDRSQKGSDVSKTAPKSFDEATRELERITGSKGRPLAGPPTSEAVLLFDTKPNEGGAVVRDEQARFLSGGTFLFLHEHRYGTGPDVVGITFTTDKLEVVRRAGTDAANYGADNAAVIAWLREIDHDDPFDLTGAGMDFVEGAFRAPVRDRAELARRIYSFCPDFVDQGIGLEEEGDPHELIERFFSTNRAFFFWWD